MTGRRCSFFTGFSLFSVLFFAYRAPAQQKNAALNKLFAAYYHENQQLYPLDATLSGDHRYDDRLANDISIAWLNAKERFNKKYLQQLARFNRNLLNTTDKISYDVLTEILTLDLERRKFHFEYLPINQFTSVPLIMAQLGSGNGAQPFKTKQDYANWINRINDFSDYTDTAIANMRTGMQTGIVLPKVLVTKMIDQMESVANADSLSNELFNPVRTLPGSFTAVEKKKIAAQMLQAVTQKLLPCYRRLAAFLKNEYLPRAAAVAGMGALPEGAAMYRFYVRSYTTTNQSPEEIYETGLHEVARIKEEMEKVKTQTGFTGSLPEFFLFLRSNKQFMPFKTPEEVLNAYRAIAAKIDKHLDSLFDLKPNTPMVIKRVEAFREAGQNGPSYLAAPADGSSAGILYVPVPDATKINVTFLGMEATYLHEAIPGHHYQIALQQENKELPAFRNHIAFSAFFEGWALYVESLGSQLGCYTDPYQQMGALNNEMHRALRLVTDVGIHTGKMTPAQAIAFMLEHESISEADATLSVERYMAIPGQALSYKTGELEIKKIRTNCEAILKDKFDLRKFHHALLVQGDMPLTVLANYMNEWAKEQLH
ncbi:hypothetical protein A3860_36915 [Niastella vici]|uniref:DUF885 domain-containing protein n=1 Tax=Niastella vici TaxID=1703345 RepID=A0A1V9FMJ4_9BACT|nr:DUF885 domain-containing protein [Niastella vici]OQP59575.1 hypothetical protein A3860_36915 [Niastella vici]